MNKDIYPFQNIEGDFIYIFISEGIHGEILKVVLITPLPDDLGDDFKPQYNLGFGDLVDIGEGWIINDAVRSGNGEMSKVIATVAKIGMEFLDKHPGATLSFTGYVDQNPLSKVRIIVIFFIREELTRIGRSFLFDIISGVSKRDGLNNMLPTHNTVGY